MINLFWLLIDLLILGRLYYITIQSGGYKNLFEAAKVWEPVACQYLLCHGIVLSLLVIDFFLYLKDVN
jgi:hypothetical protein